MSEENVVEGAPSEGDLDELFGKTPEPEEGEGQGQGDGKGVGEGEGKGKVPEVKPAPVAPASLSKEDFIEGIQQVIGGINQTREAQQQKPLTPQEIDKMLNVWVPKEDLFDRLGDPKTRVQAFLEMRDGLIQQALTASRYMIDMHKQEFEPRLEALQTFAQTQRAGELRKDFLVEFPGLAKYNKLMPFVSKQLEDSGYQAKSVAEGFKKLADEATKFIRENIDPKFEPSAKVETTTQQEGNGGALTMAAAGGRGSQGGAKALTKGSGDQLDNGIWSD